MENHEVPVQIKRLLLEQRLNPFLQQQYDLDNEMKVVLRLIKEGILKKETKPTKPITDAMKPVQARIAAYSALLDELPKPICRVPGCTGKAEHMFWDQDFCDQHAAEMVEFANKMKPVKVTVEDESESAPTDLSPELPVNDNHKEKIDA